MSDAKLQRVKIEYDGGSVYNTKVTDADTGETIPNVYRVDFTLDASAKDVPTVVLHTYLPAISVTAAASIHEVCPCCGREVNNAS